MHKDWIKPQYNKLKLQMPDFIAKYGLEFDSIGYISLRTAIRNHIIKNHETPSTYTIWLEISNIVQCEWAVIHAVDDIQIIFSDPDVIPLLRTLYEIN